MVPKEVLLEKTRWLLQHDEEGGRLAHAAHELIVRDGNTDSDRLQVILRELRSEQKDSFCCQAG